MSRRTTMKCMRLVCSTSKSRTVRPPRSTMRKASANGSPGVAVVRASLRVSPSSLTASPRTACGAIAAPARISSIAGLRPAALRAGWTSMRLPANAAPAKTRARTAVRAGGDRWVDDTGGI